jgi:alpha-amylase
MGFDAIWISPVVKNTPGGYHGFWMEDLTKVNPHFGTEADLQSLINAAHARGMLMMVGVVANHVGPVGTNYTSIPQFSDASSYHDCNGCPSDCNIAHWDNQPEVEHCRLSGLPDLNQSNPHVARTLNTWVSTLTSKYNIDGIRVDTVPEVPKAFWATFVQSAGVFQIGEVFDGRVDYVASYQPPLSSLLSYPMYFTMKGVFGYRNSMYQLRSTVQAYNANFHDTGVLGTFLDNHDNPRFLSYQQDMALYKAGLVFTIMSTGIPIVYYGTEQGFSGAIDPNNREPLWPTGFSTNAPLYQFIKQVVGWRKQYQVWLNDQVERFVDDNFYAFTRGQLFIATTNVGSQGNQITRQITYHPYSVGTRLCNLFWAGDCVSVTADGFTVVLNSGESKIFIPS